MALPWGGEVVEQENSYPYIKPVSDDIDRILGIVPGENPHCMRAVQAYRAVCEQTGRTDIRFMSPDHQGVLSTAAMIMDQSALFMAMLTDPDRVHRLLQRVSEANISFIKGLIEGAGRLDGNFWPSMWLPHTVGITVIEDMMPLLSTNLYKEFGLPYLRRYSDEFGGVFIHCCGCWTHHMRLLAESDINILGFEYLHPHVTFDDIQAHFGDIVVVPTLSAVGDHGYPNYQSFARDLLAKRKDSVRLWFASSTGRGLRPEELNALMKIGAIR
jgi:uroporphyrinogen-III decarboxylase